MPPVGLPEKANLFIFYPIKFILFYFISKDVFSLFISTQDTLVWAPVISSLVVAGIFPSPPLIQFGQAPREG